MDRRYSHDIEVQLMGRPGVLLFGEKVSFPYQKVEGLFYYLCVNSQISRSQAISVLWAESSESIARKNLRDAVYNIRKVLGQDILTVEGNTLIVLNRQRDIDIDIEHITRENLLESWKGEFLQFFFVKNCYEFEAWAEGERSERKRSYIKALQLKIMGQKIGQGLEFLEESGRILIQNEVLDEELYRIIMKKLAEAGRYLSAMEIFQSLKTFLEKEVEETPEEETQKLYEKISDMKNRLKRRPKERGEYFFGRTDILYDIYSRIGTRDGDMERRYRSFLITGEPGVGKSMLLEQIGRMVEDSDYLMFTWACCETEKDLYLMPWHGIMAKVDEYCKKNGLDVESPTDILLRQNASDVQFFMTRFEILTESVFRYLTKYFRDRKILLFIDDIQWMDSMSMRLMSNLLFRMGQGQMLVVAASREDDGDDIKSFKIPLIGRGILKEIELKPFTLEEARQVIEETDAGILDNPRLVEQIYKKTQGNPLFFMESLRLYERKENGAAFTDRMSNVIQSRLLSLSRRERVMLDIVSIFSLPVTKGEINQILGMEELQLLQILEPLLDKKILYEKLVSGEVHYGFRHQIIREYVYSCLPKEKKDIYHNYIARYYEQEYQRHRNLGTCSLVIHHYEQCGDRYKMYWYKVEYLEAFYRISYDFYPMLARKAVFSGNIDGFLAKEDELVELAEEIRLLQETDSRMTPIRMRVEYLLGRYEMFVRDCHRGKKYIEKSLELAKEISDRNYIFYNYLQLILYGDLTGQNAFMQNVIETCMAFMRDCTHHHLEEECMLIRYLGICMMKDGEYQQAEKLFMEAVKRLDHADDRTEHYRRELSACHHHMGICYIRQKKWDMASGCLKRAVEIGEKYMVSGEAGVFYSDMSLVLCRMGDLKGANAFAEKARSCFMQAGSLWGEAKTDLCCALIAEAEGRPEEGKRCRELADRTAKKLDSSFLWEELKMMEN
ncbi:AAA family ATPase [Blautia pseudococcoides]|uniref:AAA family ATPase n=1 Tax=Blautia pseudococcoides TaxID=1796616 RepID=UPI00148B0087|nr:AAA family ATPase [Blautia pseudococcoides]QJU13686.1 AAA family ATPase [Blautia pseudococcoides]